MKTALLLLILSAGAGLVLPFFLGDTISAVGMKLPQLKGSSTPPTVYNFDFVMACRMLGLIFLILAILRFTFAHANTGK